MTSTAPPDAVEDLLACPVGCAFLLAVEQNGLAPEEAVQPERSFSLAVAALRCFNPWSALEDYVPAQRAALSPASRLRGLAEALVAQPDAAWWFAPFDPERQVWIGSGSPQDRLFAQPSEGPQPWEGYAERPVHWQLTSTHEGTPRHGGSCLEAVIACGVGEWLSHRTEHRTIVSVAPGTRVYEVSGPEGWHELCRRYPFRAEQRIPDGVNVITPRWSSIPRVEVITPRWASVARDWDGVHLSFAGLLSTPMVAHESEPGTSRLWSWNTEGTMWLRHDVLEAGDALPASDWRDEWSSQQDRLRLELPS